MYGMSDDEIAAIREGRFDGFPPAEVALLRMADAVSDTPSNVSDELYAELRQHFTEDQLIELAAAAAQENFRARYNRVFDVGSDGLYRKGCVSRSAVSPSWGKVPRGTFVNRLPGLFSAIKQSSFDSQRFHRLDASRASGWNESSQRRRR